MTLFEISSRRWYGWQMLPGYSGPFLPYHSPIYVTDVVPLKSGRGILKLAFFNAFYAEGVQNFQVELKVLKRAETYLVGDLIYGKEDSGRCGIVSQIEFAWVEQFCPDLWAGKPVDRMSAPAQQSVCAYLDEAIFGRSV